MIQKLSRMKSLGLMVTAYREGSGVHSYIIADENREQVFKSQPLEASANLACFLGLCHSISILEDGEYEPFIHTNNMTALYWLEKQEVNTNALEEETLEYVKDSLDYLKDTEMEYKYYHCSDKKKKKANYYKGEYFRNKYKKA